MDLTALDKLLNVAPVVVERMHPVSLAYLRNAITVYPSLEQLALSFDNPLPIRSDRVLSFDINPQYMSRYPVVTIEHDPFTPELNHVLFEHYDLIAQSMLTQSQIAVRILAACLKKETAVLLLLDGLSYADCRDWPGTEPCLATAPTITRCGFPTVIGNHPIAAQLFSVGFTQRIGFTYWYRDNNPLTDRLFSTISDVRRLDPSRSDAFTQIIDWMVGHDLANTYIQIVYSALDEYADGHRTAVPRHAVCQQIRHDLESILDVLQHKGTNAVLFAVADHGVLWKEDSHHIELVDFTGARYAEGRNGPGRGRCFQVEGEFYWVLDYPQMGRNWKSTEQGIHGGISFEESIVPFIQWEVS